MELRLGLKSNQSEALHVLCQREQRFCCVQAERSLEPVSFLERQSRDALFLALETLRRWLRTAQRLVLPVAEGVVRLQDGVDLSRALVNNGAAGVPPEAL